MDLARPGAGTEFKSRLGARGVSIDILVNNAGYGWYGSLIDQTLDTIRDMLRLNVSRTGHILQLPAFWDIKQSPPMLFTRHQGICSPATADPYRMKGSHEMVARRCELRCAES